jgi:very-short-patch-repair endonuclease
MKKLTKYARENRKKKLKAEKLLWDTLMKWRIQFRSQRMFGGYIVDFLIPEKRLIIEVDGAYHNGREWYDDKRTKYLEELGFKVVRIRNEEVQLCYLSWLEELIQNERSQPIDDYKNVYGTAAY